MPDLHEWITQRIGAIEALAREQETSLWQVALGDDSVAATVLRRCAADRKILTRHRLDPDASWMDAAACEGCGTEGEMDYARTDNLNDCPELLDLGYAHGLTEEILTSLDRPQDGERPAPSGQSFIADALADAMYGQLFATFLSTRPIEPSPQEKAIKILGPELKKISSYVPIAEDDSPA